MCWAAPQSQRGEEGAQRMKSVRGGMSHLSQAQDAGPWTLEEPPAQKWMRDLLAKMITVMVFPILYDPRNPVRSVLSSPGFYR